MSAKICLDVPLRIGGHFHLSATNAETGETRFITEFDNLIVNQGLDYMGAGGPNSTHGFPVWAAIAVGTGTTPAAPTDTSMGVYLAGTLNTISVTYASTGAPNYGCQTISTFQFATGAAAGNLTEVGAITYPLANISVPDNTWPLFSRSLILDGGGSPTTITILPTEQLNVVYTITIFPPTTILTGTFTLSTNGTPSTINYSILGCRVGSVNATFWGWQPPAAKWSYSNFFAVNNNFVSNGTIGTVTGSPSGTISGASSGSEAAYTSGSYFISCTENYAVGQGNLTGGISAWEFDASPFRLQIGFSPAINKINTQTLSITINVSWSN